MAKREDQPLCVEYEESEPNQYGETRKKIVGVKNRFSFASVRTKLKNWVIKKAQWQMLHMMPMRRPPKQTRSVATLGLVSVTVTVQKIEQKVKNALLPVGFMINRSQIDLLIKHKRLPD